MSGVPMNHARQSRLASLLVVAVMAAACGSPSNSPDDAVEGSSPDDDGQNSNGSGGNGGGTSLDGTGGAEPGASGASPLGGGAQAAGGSAGTMVILPPPPPPPALMDGLPVCAHYPARTDGLVVDFDTYDVLDGSWGEASLGHLTGGTSPYSCADDGSCPETAVIARVRTGGGGLRIQATVPSQGYTGMVLWFGPCVDASAFGGIEFQLSGEMFGAVLSFKLQTHENYPIDLVNVKGGCEFTSEADKWSECVPPAYQISAAAAEPAAVRLGWADFGSGLPNAGVAPDGLVGVELQFECPTEVDCAMDLRLGALRFTAL